MQEITIIINGTEHTVEKKDVLTFDEVVHIAYENPPFGDNTVFSVSYRRGHGNDSGTLTEGEDVKPKEGMIFDVTPTDKS